MAETGQIRVLPNKDGSLKFEQYGTSSITGRGDWYEREEADLIGLDMRGRPASGRDAHRAKAHFEDAKRNAQRLHMKGQAAIDQSKDVDEMGFLEKASITAGRETDKLLAGAADMVDFYRDVANPKAPLSSKDIPKLGASEGLLGLPGQLIDKALGPPEGGPERSYNRSLEQADKDEFYEEFGKKAGLSQIGAMAPYYLTGTGLPSVTRGAGRLITGAQDVVKEGGRRIGGVAGDLVRKQAAKPNNTVPTKIAREVEDLIMEPAEKFLTGRRARPNISHEQRAGTAKQLGGSAALGATEGGLHYDETPLQGAVSSLFGTGMGKIYEPFTSRAPSKLTKGEKEVTDWANSKGIRLLPGEVTGQPRYQSKESGLRNDERYSGPMQQLDNANEEAVTKIVGETMGIPPEKMTDLTPDSLQAHLDDLSGQYRQLEADSIGRIDKTKVSELEARVEALPNTKEGNNARKTMQAFIDQIKGMNVVGRNDRGQFTVATFDGPMYQSTRTALKNHADSAFEKNKTLYGELKGAIELLDDGMEAGIQDHGGVVSSEMWKTLNEKYAMTKLVMNKGMNPVGGVNVKKLGNHFMENDAERLLLNKGNRVGDLHMLAKLYHIKRNQKGSGLAGPGIDHTEKAQKTERERLLNTPAALNTSLPRWLALRAYQSGYPAVTGLAGLPREGRASLPAILRIAEQGTDVHADMLEKGIDTGKKYKKKTGDVYEQLMQYIKSE